MWYMPDDATEGVVEHCFSDCNLHAQLQPLCSAALVPNVLPRRDEGLGKPCAMIEASYYINPHSGFESGRPDSES